MNSLLGGLPILPFMANGRETMVERIAYSTDIVAGRSGAEQRIRRWGHPRGGLEYSIWGYEERAAWLESMLFSHQADRWYVPLWPWATQLLADNASPDRDFYCETAESAWDDGWTPPLYAMISQERNDGQPNQMLEVDEIFDDHIHTTAGGGDWDAGQAWIMPARAGRLSTQIGSTRYSSALAEGRIAFTFDPRKDDGTLVESAAPVVGQLEDIDVLEIMPNRSDSGLAERLESRFVVLDNGTGRRQSVAAWEVSQTVRDLEFVCPSRLDALALRAFFMGKAGRLKPFWISSWQRDIELTANIGATDTTFTAKFAGYSTNLVTRPPSRRRLRFRSPDGATIIDRSIYDAYTVDNVTDNFTLSAQTDVEITPEWMVSFMRYGRFDDDELVLNWDGKVATGRVGVRELPFETPVLL